MSIGLDALPALLAALTESVARAVSVAVVEDESRETTQRVIDQHLAGIDRASDGEVGAPCVTAEAYLETGYELDRSIEIEVVGNNWGQTVSFLSGTNLSAVVAAINTMNTGVSASPALHEPTRVELRSVNAGADQFVSVRQVKPPDHPPIIFATEQSEKALYELTDFGEDGRLADVDCDDRIGMSDLTAVLRAWGECVACPEDVDGDGVVDGADIVLVLERWDDG